MAGRQAGGPETYEVSLARALAEAEGDHSLDIFCLSEAARSALQNPSPRVRYHTLRPRSRWLSIPISLPLAVRRVKPDVLHATLTAPRYPNAPLVFTIHDLTMFENPEFYRPWVRVRLQQAIRPAIERARLLVCISDCVRNEIQQRFNVSPERLVVVHHGVHSRFRRIEDARQLVSERLGITRPYLLFTGQMKLRKNIFRLIEAFALLRARGLDLDLVLVGRRGDTTEGMDELIDRCKVREHILELGHAADDLLPLLYSAAEAFVFPSLHEGFGLPVLEAMACGTPVLSSNLSALPEIAGDAALLVDPTRTEAIVDGMQQLLENSSLRAKLIESGYSRARQFSWEACAQNTLRAYRQALA
jgi:glycosyltransferase involved in cell wall biosynthesis